MNRSSRFLLRRTELLILSCILFLAVSTNGLGQPHSFRPAQFVNARLARIDISPDKMPRDTDSVAVRCQGVVELDRILSNYYCVSDNIYADREIIAATISAIPEQTFSPANIDGEDVRVVMNFAIFVHCSLESCLPHPVRNHGYLLEEYGLDYIAPQPVLSDDGWYVGFDYKVEWIRDWMPDVRLLDNWPEWDRVPFTLSVEVDAEGTAKRACLNWHRGVLNIGQDGWGGRVRRALEQALSSMNRVRYIPGFYNDQPITMRLYESSILEVSSSGQPRFSTPFSEIYCPSPSD